MSQRIADISGNEFAERLNGLGRVVSRETMDLANSLRAKGQDILSLHGAPYWLPPEHVLEAAAQGLEELSSAHAHGWLPLRQAIADKLERDNKFTADPRTEITVANAAMHGLSITFGTLLNPGDEVVLYSPAFFYFGILKLVGAVPVYVPTNQDTCWKWNSEALEKAITPRTKLIVINTPTNPTGYVATEDDLMAVAEIARKHDLWVLSDEAYDSMIYDNHRHISFASLPGAKDRTITVYSMTKSYAMKQWRVGFIVAPETLSTELRKVLEWNVLSCNHVAQYAAKAALEGPQAWVKDIARRFQISRDVLLEGLQSAKGLSYIKPQGAPFLYINTAQLGVSGDEFFRTLLYDYGVPSDPGLPFGSGSHIRFEFGGEPEVVQEAARRVSLATQALMSKRDS